MKAVYIAARAILFPKNAHHQATPAFLNGRGGLPANVAQCLLAFERAHRGHRHLLELPTVHAENTEAYLAVGERRSAQSIRKSLRNTVYQLCRAAVQAGQFSAEWKVTNLLSAEDTSGLFRAFSYEELKTLCGNATTTGLPVNYYLDQMRVESGSQPILHVVVKRTDGAAVRRSIALSKVSPTTLGGVRSFVLDSLRLIQLSLRDYRTWSEFGGSIPKTASPAPKMVLVDPQTDFASIPEQFHLPDNPALTAQLQQHMQSFFDLCSPEVQVHMAEHWSLLRPTKSSS